MVAATTLILARMKNNTSNNLQLSLFDESFFAETPKSNDMKMGTMLQPVASKPSPMQQNIPEKADAEEALRKRKKRQRLKVTLCNGETICDASATTTMTRTIERIGVERVAALGMTNCHIPLVARKVYEQYADWTKEIQPGWYIMAQGDTEQKYLQLKSIVSQLRLYIKVELGNCDSLPSQSNERKSTSRKKKARLEVEFADGTIVTNYDAQHTFVSVAKLIGIDKIKHTNINIGGKPIITSTHQYNCQVQLSSEEWLTIPAQIKDKYKILRVMSSMTHVSINIKIID